MKRRRTHYRSTNPFLAWTGLATKTTELVMASAQVITHRTNRIAMAGPAPCERDQREFALMGQEKIDALSESAFAMAARMISLNQQLGTLAFRQMMVGTNGIMSLATSRTLAQTSKVQEELVRETLSGSADAMSQLANTVAKVAHKGLQPIHSRATANARRLSRVK